MRRAVIIGLATLAVGAQAHAVGPVFPPPPAEPRLHFEESVHDASDYDRGRSLLGRLADLIAGGEDPAVLTRPHGLACAGDLLLVADPDAGLVHGFDRREQTYRRFPAEGRLATPVDAAGASDGQVLVSDAAAGVVVLYDVEGREVARTDATERPSGIAVHHGRVYVADPGAHQVMVFDLDLTPITAFGTRGDTGASFNYPVDVCVNDDAVWVLDSLNFRICRLTHDGAFVSSFGGQGDVAGSFARPRGLSLDADGHLWVSDALQDGVQVFDADGRLLMAFGSRGRADGEFWMPAGLAFDDDDRLYVADAYNRRVQVFRYVPDTERGRR